MDTYDQLRLSLIRDSALVRGKAFASMVMAVLFAVAVLPMFGISQFLLGLDNEHIYVIAIYILLFALMVVSVSSAAAFAFGRLVPALLVSYGICGMLLLSPLWFGAEAYNYGSGLVFLPRDEFSLLERFPVIGSWMLSFLFPSTALLTIVLDLVHYELFAVQCTILAGLSLLAYGIAIKSLRRRDRFESSVQSREVTDEQSLHARRASFPYYLVDPLRPKPSISDHQNPVLVREFRCALFYKLSTMIRVACVTFVFALFAIAAAS
ncbi:MAG: hypothetical protein SGI88_20995, partial [Candidatus Hydrogenedentes bacterium]|nr:hypothetical protein [Candidatus Hydrogenedentota bacterium]